MMEKPVPKHRLVESPLTVAALYKFAPLENLDQKRQLLLDLCERNEVLGTFLLAEEGINGTVAGSPEAIHIVIDWIRSWQEIEQLEVKFSKSDSRNFRRMKVRIKKEIVTMGMENVDPLNQSGEYIEPGDWNQFITQDEVMVIDTRNTYEVSMGKFKDAINPNTENFSEFPDWLDDLSNIEDKTQKIAMYCTGGIRCEKATAYMKQIGFENVFQLKGGILKYLEEIPKAESMWEGECFVFDERVSVGHNLKVGSYALCHACRHAINEHDKLSPLYQLGISCPKCYKITSDIQKKRFKERQKQVDLAKARNEVHIGSKPIFS